METYGYNRQKKWGPNGTATTLCDAVKQYDFSQAKGVLIASTPGYYNLGTPAANNRGYLKLSQAIQQYCRNVSPAPTPTSLVCQFSSIGALSVTYLNDFVKALDVRQRPCQNLAARLQLVFPTPACIRNSVEGYTGGGTVPSKKTNVQKPFLQESCLLRRCCFSPPFSLTAKRAFRRATRGGDPSLPRRCTRIRPLPLPT